MVKNIPISIALSAWMLFQLSACVTTSKYEKALANAAQAKVQHEAVNQGLMGEREAETQKVKACRKDLAQALDQNQTLVSKIKEMGQDVEQLLGEKGALSQERERLELEQSHLATEVLELRRLRESAESRNAEYRALFDRLKNMIDAGTLAVKVRNGKLVVQMSSDVLFESGSTTIREEGKAAIEQLSQYISMMSDRQFQVVGHTDNVPIKTNRFPSNWELSTGRASEVVKLMIASNVNPKMLSAAGQGENDPVAANETKEGKAQNRRVEFVFMPRLDELPGMEGVLEGPVQPK